MRGDFVLIVGVNDRGVEHRATVAVVYYAAGHDLGQGQ